MAFNSVKRPRIYCNLIDYHNFMGNDEIEIYSQLHSGYIVDNIPHKYRRLFNTFPEGDAFHQHGYGFINLKGLSNKSFVAFLGHSFSTDNIYQNLFTATEEGANQGGDVVYEHLVNDSISIVPDKDGYSITTFECPKSASGEFLNNIYITNNIETSLGSLILGCYFDFEHSVESKVNVSYEMEGLEKITINNGKYLSHSKYINRSYWPNSYYPSVPAWELHDNGVMSYNDSTYDYGLSRKGRKTWTLSFSYLNHKNVFGSNPITGNHTSHTNQELSNLGYNIDVYDGTPNNEFDNDLHSEDTFFKMLELTAGGRLPILFQPDSNDNTDIVIAKLDMSTYSFKTSNTQSSISIKIREVW